MRLYKDKNKKQYELLHDFLRKQNSKYNYINKEFGPGDRVIDKFRLQTPVKGKVKFKEMKSLMKLMLEKAQIILLSCRSLEELILFSKPRGTIQQQHNSYTPEYIEECTAEGSRSISGIAAI